MKTRISLKNPQPGGGFLFVTVTWPAAPRVGDLVTVEIPNLLGEPFTEIVRITALTLTGTGHDALGEVIHEAMGDLRVLAQGGIWAMLKGAGASLHADELVNLSFLRTLRMLMARVPERDDPGEVPALGRLGGSIRVYANAVGRGEERLFAAIQQVLGAMKGFERAARAAERWFEPPERGEERAA
ncbi:MAG TPA: hypothetical protein VGM87_22235 [Roseomonas sp.]